jgi:alpha-beta hydrolase superfamily lysophospholipase
VRLEDATRLPDESPGTFIDIFAGWLRGDAGSVAGGVSAPRVLDELTFVDADGVEVFGWRSLPEEPARSIVVVVHGASEHSRRYVRLADALTAHGHAVYALDQRGHGRTAQSTGPGRTGPRGMDGMLDDVHQLVTCARAEVPGVPIVVFGHSMGSLVTQAYVQRHGDELAGYVLSGSMGPIENADEMVAAMRAAIEAGMADVAVEAPPELFTQLNAGFEPVRTTFDWLSRDADEVDLYIADPMCGDEVPMTYGFVAETLNTASVVMEPPGIAQIPKPVRVLLLAGDADPVSNRAVQIRELERRLRDAGLDVVAKYYPGGRHEILNEINRDEVTADLLAWLDRVVS